MLQLFKESLLTFLGRKQQMLEKIIKNVGKNIIRWDKNNLNNKFVKNLYVNFKQQRQIWLMPFSKHSDGFWAVFNFEKWFKVNITLKLFANMTKIIYLIIFWKTLVCIWKSKSILGWCHTSFKDLWLFFCGFW